MVKLGAGRFTVLQSMSDMRGVIRVEALDRCGLLKAEGGRRGH